MRKSSMTTEAKTEELDEVVAFVTQYLDEEGCPMKTRMEIECAAEEIFVNICYYAYPPDTGPVIISAEYRKDEKLLSVTFSDKGKPYDPLAKKDPDVAAAAQNDVLGGLGIFLTKKLMDHVSYQYLDGSNILTIQKAV